MPAPRSSFSSKNSESGLIQAIRARADHHSGTSDLRAGSGDVRVGIGDDCAVLRTKSSEEIVVTTDLSIERMHFRREWHAPESVGYRCLARGLSDIAAMGARPVAAFVSLALPLDLSGGQRGQSSWLNRFYNGLLRLAGEHAVPLAGGDLAQAPELVTADIVLVGAVRRGRALLRSGAKAGDLIYVTGALGGAAAELLVMQRSNGKYPSAQPKRRRATPSYSTEDHPHLYPQPRLAVGQQLVRRRLATAAIDLSDGVSTDLTHLCEESELAAEIDAAALPIHIMAELAASAGLTDSALKLALHGGEDYELLFTASHAAKMPVAIAGVPIHPIGRMKKVRRNHPLISMKLSGESLALEAQGWEHFR